MPMQFCKSWPRLPDRKHNDAPGLPLGASFSLLLLLIDNVVWKHRGGNKVSRIDLQRISYVIEAYANRGFRIKTFGTK